MEVSVTRKEGLECELRVQVERGTLESQVRDRLKSLARGVRMDGFRPGKVPMKVVERRYGAQVRSEVTAEMLEQSFRDAVRQENLRPAGRPEIEPDEQAAEEALSFRARFEVYPEFETNVPADLTVEKPAVEITEGDVDAVLERMRSQHRDYQAVERAAQKEDRVNMDFLGTLNGEPFEGGEAKDFSLVLGSNTLIPGFEDKLEGVKAGDTTEFDITFPDDYHVAELAGKPVHFSVTVQRVEEPRLPEINDEFAQMFGVGEGGLAKLREQVRENMQREAEQAIKQQLKNRVLDALDQANPIQLPKALVEEEVTAQVARARYELGSRGIPSENINLSRDMFRDQAKKRVSIGLLVADILRRQSLQVSAAEVRAEIEKMANTYEDPQQVLQWYYGQRERLANVEAMLLEDKAVAWVMEKANVVEKPVTFTELMQPASQRGSSAGS